MEFYFIHEGPLWIDILILSIGLIFIIVGWHFLKKEVAFHPIIHIHKDKNPFAFWIVICYWLGFGVFSLILGLIMII